MCTQSVGLVAAVLEAQGIPTTCIVLVRPLAEVVRPPRALAVPFPFGSAMGPPHDERTQLSVLRAALALLERPGPGPVLADWRG